MAWKRFFLLSVLLFIGTLLALVTPHASASRQPDPALPPPAAPEPYPNSDKFPAVVYLASQDELQMLYRLKVDMEGLQPVEGVMEQPGAFKPVLATVYINPDEATALTQAGLAFVPIPNEGYRSFLEYGPDSGVMDAWPTFEQYVLRMQALHTAHPDIVDLVQIGTSVEGRGLYCMEITDNPGVDEYEPEFKYTANHHGDETTGV